MNIDEMKNRISLALKDPILQQGFEIICKENAELEKENARLKNERNAFKIYSDNAELDAIKLNEQLTKAKELLKWFVWYFREGSPNLKHKVAEAEQFLKEE